MAVMAATTLLALLSACGGGPVKRVSQPAASIQQLTVRTDGSWSVDLRLDNYSSVGMRFDATALAVTVGGESAGTLAGNPRCPSVRNRRTSPRSRSCPTSAAKIAVADCAVRSPQPRLYARRDDHGIAGRRQAAHVRRRARQYAQPRARPAGRAALKDIQMASSYRAPLADMRFALFDVLGAESLFARLGFDDATRDVLDAVLDEAARFTETVLAPLNDVGDRIGCTYDKATGEVRTPPGFRDAYSKFVDGGWPGLVSPPEFGGQGLPHLAGLPLKEMIDAANLAWGNFPLLSHGATEALLHHGEDWQREVFLKPIVDGRWTGTMCLTESHCGTDLGLLKTRAEPQADGSHAITGTKIFITAGEHDLTDNIVHLVLARLPDAPAGVKGISLFIVPKMRTARDGTMGDANAVRCGALEHKMGIHGSATCVINFDGAQGYLIGAPNKGLAAMFTMMNTARLAVGLQGLGLSDRAYQNALHYARTACRCARCRDPSVPTNRPTRSSCTPTCAACCSRASR
jgi:alkylation response protein AidB-like acyl-CoA dehydrogenase